jgi:hypothetical protein
LRKVNNIRNELAMKHGKGIWLKEDYWESEGTQEV